MISLRHRRILLALYRLSGGTSRPCRYEDIVVKAFELFPTEFQLRGHPQYPDSSDIHKPLYGPLKRLGFVKAANKTFSLTPAGLQAASGLGTQATAGKTKGARMGREQLAEVTRLLGTAAVSLFRQGKREDILDTDFYSYLGVTVRTPPNDFLGRLSAVSAAIEGARHEAHATAQELKALHAFLLEKFAPRISALSRRVE